MSDFNGPSHACMVGKAIKVYGSRPCYWWPVGRGQTADVIVQYADGKKGRITVPRKKFEQDFVQEAQARQLSDQLAQRLHELPSWQVWVARNRIYREEKAK